MPADTGPPPDEAELALLLIGTRLRRGAMADRIRDLASSVNYDALAALLVEQRILVLAGSRLIEMPSDAAPPWFRRSVAEARARAFHRGLAFSAVLEGLTHALEAANVVAVPLKGMSLAAELHGDLASREYADIDVLVAAEDLSRAASVTRRLGWTLGEPDPPTPPRLHLVLRHPNASMPPVEIHWRIHWYERRFARALLHDSRTVDGVRLLSPIHQFAALLLFYARDGFVGLRLAADIAAWWDRYGSSTTPAVLQGLIAEYPALAEALRAALTAAASVAGLPNETAPSTLRPRTRRAALACRLTNWDLRGDPDQIRANVKLVDGLLAPRGGLAEFLGRQVLTPADPNGERPERMRQLHADRGVHACKTLGRFTVGLLQLRHGQRWSRLPTAG